MSEVNSEPPEGAAEAPSTPNAGLRRPGHSCKDLETWLHFLVPSNYYLNPAKTERWGFSRLSGQEHLLFF